MTAAQALLETMRVASGQVTLWPYHWQRLQHSMGRLRMHIPASLEPDLQYHIKALAAISGEEQLRARLLVAASGNTVTYLLEMAPYQHQHGKIYEVALFEEDRKTVHKDDGIKKAGDRFYEKARLSVTRKKVDEVLIINGHDDIIEGSISNVFIVRNGQVFTPPLSAGCIDGVYRRALLEKAATIRIFITEADLPIATLAAAEEIFLTNALRGIMPVAVCNGKAYPQNISLQLRQMMETF